MTNEEIVTLIKAGNREHIEQLYLQNKNLILKIASKYQKYDEIDDLIQEAYFGLLKAVDLWDANGGAAFSTYAAYWIKQSIWSYLENNGSVLRLPSHRRQRLHSYSKFISEFVRDFGRDPSPAEICAALGVTIDQIEIIKQDAKALSIRSTAEAVSDDGDLTLEDMIRDPSDQMDGVIDKIQNEQLARILWEMVDQLQEKESNALRNRFIDEMQYSEIADQLGFESAGQARDVTERALKKLRHQSHKLRPFWDEYVTMAYQATGLKYFKNTMTSSPERAIIMLEQRKNEKPPF